MKTKTLLIVCLLLGIGMARLSAQTEVVRNVQVGWGCPIFCEGVEVDYLWGIGEAQFIDHFENGEWIWEIIIFKGIGRNAANEKFSFSEQNKIYYSHKIGDYTWTAHDNVKMRGDHKTLYNVSLIINPYDGTYEVKNGTCTGNSDYK